MSISLTLQDLRRLAAAHLGQPLEEVGSQHRLVEDLGVDSLEMHALLIQIEEAGGVIPSPEALSRVITLADLHDAIIAHAAAP